MILKKILLHFFNLLKFPINQIIKIKKFKKLNFMSKSIFEGEIVTILPKVYYYDILFNNKQIKKIYDFVTHQTQSELLLKEIIYNLYSNNYFDKKKSIIDIGCWIGDNSVVWSKMIDISAKLYAIDPSPENLQFGKELSKLNKIYNIEWINAVCSETVGEKLEFKGNLDHTSFFEHKDISNSKNVILSNTLDNIVNENNHYNISLIHVDVEGFEFKVLKGAKKIINKSKPLILYEQHISSEDINIIKNYLEYFGYDIYMINEIIPGNALDNRNFIAFSNKNIPNYILKNTDQHKNVKSGIFNACVGDKIIKI